MMQPGTWIVIGVSAFLVLWYAGGHLYNRWRGQRLFRWLEKGLDVLDGEREAGWIGSPASGARVNVTHASAPFRRLEVTLLLENREIPVLWLLDRLRGRRDRSIIKATLRSPRQGEIRVSSGGRDTAHQEQSWTLRERASDLLIAQRGRNVQRLVAALEPWLETYGAHLDRFFWRKQDPHIILQVRMAELVQVSAESFFIDLKAALQN